MQDYKTRVLYINQMKLRSNRKIRHRLSTLTLLLALLLIGISAAATGYSAPRLWGWLCQSPYFYIKEIKVTPGYRLEGEEILRAVNITPNTSIFSFNLRSTTDRLLAQPWIKSVHLWRILPHTLQISFEEREPEALIKIDDHLYYLDSTGSIFKHVGLEDELNYPLINGLSWEILNRDPSPLGTIITVLKLFHSSCQDSRGTACRASMGTACRAPTLSELYWDPTFGINLYILSPVRDSSLPAPLCGGAVKAQVLEIRLGLPPYPIKWKNLLGCLAEIRARKIAVRYIDLNNIHRVCVGLEKPQDLETLKP